MCSSWKSESDYKPSCVDDSGFCGNHGDTTELGCELLLFLRFLRRAREDMKGMRTRKAWYGNALIAFPKGVSVELRLEF